LPVEEDDEIDGVAEPSKKPGVTKTAKVIKGMVNKVALSGDQVLADALYQKASETGYYIWSIAWTCKNIADNRFHIDCVAAFSDSIKADQLTWDVVRKWQYKPEDPDVEELVKMTDQERRQLVALVEEAAFRAYAKVQK